MKNCHSKYKPTIPNFQPQLWNETFTNEYNLAPLTLSEIEAALLSIDENTDTNSIKANFVQNKRNDRKSCVPNQEIICYYCKQPGHITRPECPLLKKKQEQQQYKQNL